MNKQKNKQTAKTTPHFVATVFGFGFVFFYNEKIL